MKLRAKIVTTYIGTMVAGVILASVLSSWLINRSLDRRRIDALESEVSLLASLLQSGTLPIDSAGTTDQEWKSAARILNLRLTVIARDGRVVFDSEVPRDSLPVLENHAQRPEIQSARRNGWGTDRRKSKSVDEDFVYAARMITGAGPTDSTFVRGALHLQQVQALDAQVEAIAWIIGVLSIVVVGFVSYTIAGRITRPVLNIAATAHAIREGDLERRVAIRSRDEIGSLAAAINDMAETLSTDIARLRKLETVRNQFLANVSHELRTPIFSIQGFLETLLDGAVDDPAVNRDFLEKAHRHAARLNALLNDLIEISRIESGEMKMSFRYFPINEFLAGMIEECKPMAEKKTIALTFETGVAADGMVYGDRDRLRQVMVNLLDNAVKYTGEGGSVRCRARVEDPWCVVEVADTGCGIAEEHLGRIFERFYRVDKDRSREVGGTGLGLAIVKHIVEAHGGTIGVTSTVGKGSTFAFTLKR